MKLSACAKVCYIELMQSSIHSFNRSIASTQHRLRRSLFVHAFHVRQEPYKHTHKRLFTVSCPSDLHSPGNWGAPHQHKEAKQVREHKHKKRRPNICHTCQVTSSYSYIRDVMQRWRYSECMYVFILKCKTADQYRTVNLKTQTISAIIDDTSAQYEIKKIMIRDSYVFSHCIKSQKLNPTWMSNLYYTQAYSCWNHPINSFLWAH